ncbi:MAG: NUDIX domain-containing protein [Gammaproteobacteria bacterium]|nr:NUDIX domain-containing protein [Gammaproteobacteria bacterium]
MSDTNTRPATAVVLFTMDRGLKVLLVGGSRWHLPCGPVEDGESLAACAKRMVTNAVRHSEIYLEQLYTFDGATLGTQGTGIVVTYYALAPLDKVGIPDRDSRWFALADAPALPDGHQRIVDCAGDRLTAKLAYTTIAHQFLPDQFTLAELQAVYEAISQQPLDKRNFRRRLQSSDHLVETGGIRRDGRHRPARLYRLRQPDQVAALRQGNPK